MDDSHPSFGKPRFGLHLRPEIRKLILDVLKEIDPEPRNVLWMHDAEDRSMAEIAAALSITPKAAQAQLRNARRKFQWLIAQLCTLRVPFASEIPFNLAALREADGDAPAVPFQASDQLLREMAMTLRVLNPDSLAASLAAEERPPDSSIRKRLPPGKKPRPKGRE
jgi:hypothetical protein